MKMLSELRKQNNEQSMLEVEKIAELLSNTNSSSDEFTKLLAVMKNKINQMSDE